MKKLMIAIILCISTGCVRHIDRRNYATMSNKNRIITSIIRPIKRGLSLSYGRDVDSEYVLADLKLIGKLV